LGRARAAWPTEPALMRPSRGKFYENHPQCEGRVSYLITRPRSPLIFLIASKGRVIAVPRAPGPPRLSSRHRRAPSHAAANLSHEISRDADRQGLWRKRTGTYDAALAGEEAVEPCGQHVANPADATIRKRSGSSSPWLAAAIISVAMSSRTTSGWLVQ
jgi:hypothetical protein